MKRLLISLFLISGMMVKADEAQSSFESIRPPWQTTPKPLIHSINPNIFLTAIYTFDKERVEYLEELFKKEKANIEENLLHHYLLLDEIQSPDEIGSVKDKKFKTLFASVFREKLEKFAHYSIPDQACLLTEHGLRLGLLENRGDMEFMLGRVELVGKQDGGKMVVLATMLIDCLNNAPQENRLEHDIQCLDKQEEYISLINENKPTTDTPQN